MRILYVEDNPELRETIGKLMEGEGRTVTPCASAEEALALDAGDPFDVLVTDVSLPGLSGTDLARQLLADDPQRWVVLCSGMNWAAIRAVGGRTCAPCSNPSNWKSWSSCSIPSIARWPRPPADACGHGPLAVRLPLSHHPGGPFTASRGRLVC